MSEELIGRKIKDMNDNIYVFELSEDVNADYIPDILLSATQGIAKLVAYKIDKDVFRTIDGNKIGPSASKFNWPYWRLIYLRDPETDITQMEQDEFGKMMEEVIKISKEVKLENKPKLTHWKGQRVEFDKRGYYFPKSFMCHGDGCSNRVIGRHRLSLSAIDGEISRSQSFVADDPRACRVKPNSKNWLCGDCAPHSVPIPERKQVEEPIQHVEETPKPPVVPELEAAKQELEPEQVKQINPKFFTLLEDLANPKAETDLQFLKGFVYAMTQLGQ